jgi:phosphate starvation-inducible PhoH-like protein
MGAFHIFVKIIQKSLTELIYTLEIINPQLFYGPNNQHLNLIKSKYPKLQFVARGDEIKVFGDQESLVNFRSGMGVLEKLYINTGELNERTISDALEIPEGSEPEARELNDDVLFIGTRGQKIKAKTRNQRKMLDACKSNDVLFAIGPAGTGKTYTAVALAVLALKNREIRKIILTRPAVEAGENLGFLPGDLKEKIDPYLRPLYDALEDMIPLDKLKSMIESRTVEIAPLAFMRGRTLDNCFVILDEAQNATELQLKMFLTRMGPNAKMIITGDMSQIDLPRKHMSGLFKALRILTNIEGISIIELDTSDVVRHKLVREIIKAYEKSEDQNQ